MPVPRKARSALRAPLFGLPRPRHRRCGEGATATAIRKQMQDLTLYHQRWSKEKRTRQPRGFPTPLSSWSTPARAFLASLLVPPRPPQGGPATRQKVELGGRSLPRRSCGGRRDGPATMALQGRKTRRRAHPRPPEEDIEIFLETREETDRGRCSLKRSRRGPPRLNRGPAQDLGRPQLVPGTELSL